MNDSTASQPGVSLLPDSIATITTIHFVLMLLVALAAIAVICDGRLAEPHRGLVRLVESHKMRQQPRRWADTEHQKPGRHRVERSGVSHFPGAERTSRFRDDIMTRPRLGFVDQQNAALGGEL